MKRKFINRMALLCAILLLVAGNMNMRAETRTVTTEALEGEGSLPSVIAQLQNGDILTFDRTTVNTITLTSNISTAKLITILGNGVTIAAQSGQYIKLTGSPVQVEDLHWETELQIASETSRVINCTFKPSSYAKYALSGNNKTSNISFEGCAFLSDENNTAYVQMTASSSKSTYHVHFTSCTFFVNSTVSRTKSSQGVSATVMKCDYYLSASQSVTFTNCVLLDPAATDEYPSVNVYNIQTKGYNVFQGVLKPYGNGPAWTPDTDSDILIASDAAEEDIPLKYDEGIYKVVAGKAAYRHLPAEPTQNDKMKDVVFPQKDLSGKAIDYATLSTHSGAWQEVYGDEGGGDNVVVTDIRVNFPSDNALFTDTTYRFTASVLSENSDAAQEVTWECASEHVTITPSGTGNIYASFRAKGITEDTPITVKLTARDNGSDNQPFVREYQITLKPYIHVGNIMLTDLAVAFGYENGLRATVLPADANWKDLEWTVDDPAVASITVHPGADSVTFKGLTEGTTTVFARAKDNNTINTLSLTVSRPDYSDGVFVVNEDWWGHYPGSVNFLYDDGRIDHNAFQHANHTPLYTLGSPAQYGAIYGDKFYIISKADKKLVVADARTLELHRGFYNLGSNMGEGRFFFGVDEHTGYVGTANGLRVVPLDELPYMEGNVKLDGINPDPKLVANLPGFSITSLQSGGGSFTGQVTTMKRVDERIFALQQGVVHVITATSHQVEATLDDHIYTTMTQSKNGDIWLGTSGTVPTGGAWNPQEDEQQADGELTGYFVRLDPWTLERTVVPLPGDVTGTGSTYGAWQADAFQGSATDNVLYWKSDHLHILRYDIDAHKVDTVLDLRDMPRHPDVVANTPWTLYGPSFAVDYETGKLVVVTGTFLITTTPNDRNNWKILRVDPNGGQPRADENGVIGNIISEHPLEKNYWFPAMPVFPDKRRPEFTSAPFPQTVTLSGAHPVDSLDLIDKVNDADNMRAAIVTTVLDGYNKSLVNAFIWRDTLVVAARKTIPAGQPAESTTVTLKFNSNGHVITRELDVTVQPGVATHPATGVTLDHTTAELTVGQTLTLTATVAPDDASNKTVTWTSSAPAVASVSNAGVVTALSVSGAAVDITATTVDGGFTAVCTVSTKAAGSSAVPVTGVTLNRTAAELTVGQALALTATVAPANATNKTVTWTSSVPAVASVNSAGVVTALSVSGAAVDITATTVDGGFTAVCTVLTKAADPIVTNPFELNQHSLTLYPGQNITLALTAPQHFNVTWSSSAPSVATVGSGGVVRSVSAGTTTIIARDFAKDKVDICTVTVLPFPVSTPESIELNTSFLNLIQGETATLRATSSPGLAGKPVIWSSSVPGVADVTAGGMVIAFAPGVCVIRATIDSWSATCTVQVSAPREKMEVDDVTTDGARIFIPKMTGASYYLLHLYTKQGFTLAPVYTLKVTPDGIVTLRSTAVDNLVVPLVYLSPATSYIVEAETIRELQGKADVIRTEMVAFTTSTITGVEEIFEAQPGVWYANGTLRIAHLDGYVCTVTSVSGRHTHQFRVVSPDESRRIQLVPGVYVLTARKDDDRKAFKFVVIQ
jgi:uncharacterized protein YjdB